MEKKKKYTIKPTKKQLVIMKDGWKQLQAEEDKFYQKVVAVEKWIEIETGIKGVEFFMCDNSYVGIGNVDRTMKLVQLR